MEELFFIGVTWLLSGLLAHCVDSSILVFDDNSQVFDYEYEELEHRNRCMRRVVEYATWGFVAFACTFFRNLPVFYLKRRNECQ